MSDEVQNEIAAMPAPEPELTVVSEPEAVAPENEEPKVAKTFTQDELDAAIGKRLAREQRKWEREQARVQQPAAAQTAAPSLDQFESVDQYADALAFQKAEHLIAKRDADRVRMDTAEAYQDREEEARAKYEDFEQVAYNPRLPITGVMAETIQSSDIGPDIAYYLGTNPKEADRISRLSPFMQAKELGKVEAKLSDNPPVKKTTSAPPPIAPISGRGSGVPAYDTTDPRSIKNMTTSEWIEADRQRQMKKWEASRNR